MPRRPVRRRMAAPVLIALLLVAASLATSLLAVRGAAPTSSSVLNASTGPSTISTSTPAVAASPAHALPAQASPNCTRPSGEFGALWGGAWPPAAVAPTLQSNSTCAWGTDQSALGFLSNDSNSADRASFTILLPPAGTATGQTLAAVSFQIWVAGVPCSFDQASAVDVELIPPASPYASNFSPDWSVRAPAYDLAPPSSCDPTCSNDTALFSIDGSAFCEDQIVRDVLGAPPTSPTGSFAPGDELDLTFVGTAGGTSPLLVYLNDSTHPGGNLSFSYNADSILDDQPLVPMFSEASISQGVWGLTPGISAVADLCPWSGVATPACFSYNASTEHAVAPITIASADYWNASLGSYSNAYGAVAAGSSTGGCTAGPIACEGFSEPSGGFYPYWSLDNATNRSGDLPVWEFGGTSPGELRSFGGGLAASAIEGAQFATLATASDLSSAVVGSNIEVSVVLADPVGIAGATISMDFCQGYPGGEASVATAEVAGGPSLTDSFVNVPFLQLGDSGPFPYWVVVTSTLGTVSPPVFGSANVSGTSTCHFPQPTVPTLHAANVTPLVGGYAVRWTEADPSAVGYMVDAKAPNGTVLHLPIGDQTEANLSLGAYLTSFNLSVAAVNGRGNWSAASPVVAAAPTLAHLAVSVAAPPPSSAWLGTAALNLSGVVSGGQGPYTVELLPGDGSSVVNFSSTGQFTVAHNYGSYWGDAVVTIQATDAVGDVASAGPFVLSIRATPLGVLQVASAGELVVNISFSVPESPVAPLTNFAIVSTSNASLVWELEAGAASNSTIPGILIWNTTAAFAELNEPDGVPLYAQVLARNSFGVGWLPEGRGTLIATAEPLNLSPISSVPGGRAPFTENVSASVTGGTNDTITRALYSYPPDNIITPTITDVNGTTYLNASLSFPSPGTFIIVLHATDIFFGTAIGTTTVYIAVGISPVASAELVSSPAYVDAPLSFQAAAAEGSGDYGWNWSFGDGNYSSLPNPIHSYALSGGYNVVLEVTDLVTGGFNVTTLPIVVYALPVLFVSVTPGPNGSLSYDFRASVGGGSGPSTVVWTFGDGGLARGDTVSHDYRSAGTYLVNVSATDPAGRSGTSEFNLSAFASSAGGSSTSPGLSSLDVTLIILAAGFGVIALLLAVRRPTAPPPRPVDASEDGEVSLP
jgi:PKD domain-containing protein